MRWLGEGIPDGDNGTVFISEQVKKFDEANGKRANKISTMSFTL